MGIAERKEREKQQRRNDIVDAAEKIFFTRGFENSTMEEVAAEAELSKGTIYLYFKSRDDLQFAIFMRGSDILMKMMGEELSEENDGYSNLISLAGSFIRFSSACRHLRHTWPTDLSTVSGRDGAGRGGVVNIAWQRRITTQEIHQGSS